jgi:hypothetical protein
MGEGTSLNQFINVAVAEKLSALETEDFLRREPKPRNVKISSGFLMALETRHRSMVTRWGHHATKRAAAF